MTETIRPQFFLGAAIRVHPDLPIVAGLPSPETTASGGAPAAQAAPRTIPPEAEAMEPRMTQPVQQSFADMFAEYGRERDNLIPLLQAIQDRYSFLSPDAVRQVAEHLELSENDVYGVATFYAQFRFTPPGLHHVRVCQGTACHVRGSLGILERVQSELGLTHEQVTTPDLRFTLEPVACIGACGLAPVIMIDDETHGRLTKDKVPDIIARYE